jgi:hypothetical protein
MTEQQSRSSDWTDKEFCQVCESTHGRSHELTLSMKAETKTIDLRLCSECSTDLSEESWITVERP